MKDDNEANGVETPDSEQTRRSSHCYVAVIKGVDGRCLGLSFDDGSHINREDYESWQSFLADFALLVMTRIPKDTESEHAKRLIEEDSKRVGELLSQTVSST
jgi:hypothetical protein